MRGSADTGALDDNETIAAWEIHIPISNISFLVLNMKTYVSYDTRHHRKYSPAFLVAHIIMNCKPVFRRRRGANCPDELLRSS